MALHLFPTPVECKKCGSIVDDPTVDHCPNCGELLKERRTPSRLAGVERRYDNFRLLLSFLRFLGIIMGVTGILVFFFAEGSLSLAWRSLAMAGSIVAGVGFLLIAATLEIFADLEENSRATFRVLQSILDQMRTATVADRSSDAPG